MNDKFIPKLHAYEHPKKQRMMKNRDQDISLSNIMLKIIRQEVAELVEDVSNDQTQPPPDS